MRGRHLSQWYVTSKSHSLLWVAPFFTLFAMMGWVTKKKFQLVRCVAGLVASSCMFFYSSRLCPWAPYTLTAHGTACVVLCGDLSFQARCTHHKMPSLFPVCLRWTFRQQLCADMTFRLVSRQKSHRTLHQCKPTGTELGCNIGDSFLAQVCRQEKKTS